MLSRLQPISSADDTPQGDAAPDERVLARRLREAEAALSTLRAEHAWAADLLHAVHEAEDGIALIDPHGRIAFANDAHARLFGWPPHALPGQHWGVLFGPEERLRMMGEILPLLRTQRQWRGEVTGQSGAGAVVMCEIAVTALPWGALLCTTRDNAPRKAREVRLREMEERLCLLARQEALARTTQAMAHDINNLMAAIEGYAMLLEGDLAADSVQQGWARNILTATAQASEVLQTARGHSPATAASLPGPPSCDLEQVLRSACDLAEPFRPAGVRVALTLVPDLSPVGVDATALSRALLNVIKNAFEVMPEGGRLRITVRPGTQGQGSSKGKPNSANPPPAISELQLGEEPALCAARVDVCDTGPGFPHGWLELADPVAISTKPDGVGHGFGLQSLHELAASGQAGVLIRSRAGVGTCVRFSLPPGLSLEAPGTRAQQTVPIEPARILIVDDNRTVGEVLSQLVRKLGHHTRLVTDPREAITILRQNPSAFDILLTDFDMPWMNGDALAQIARALRSDLPVILCSGESEFIAPGTEGLIGLAKPVRLEALEKAICAALVHSNRAP